MLNKIVNLLKMSFMFTWRFLLLSVLLFGGRYNSEAPLVGIVIAAVLVFGSNKAILTWPIIRLLSGKRVVIFADAWGSDGKRTPRKTQVRQPKTTTPKAVKPTITEYVERATRNGVITGYEPRALESLPLPKTLNMHGEPGAALLEAEDLSEVNTQLGFIGEQNFAKALAKAGVLNRFETYWSVPVPDVESFQPGPYGTDIDCVLISRDAVYLIDLKNYKSGDVLYYSYENQLYCEDLATGKQVGRIKTMTRNMELAAKAYRNKFRDVPIYPVVVFMPTDKGEGFINNVRWPGNIPADTLSNFISVIAQQRDFEYQTPASGVGIYTEILRKKGVNRTIDD